MKSILCVIDTDKGFSDRFSKQLKYAKMNDSYEVVNISPDASLDPLALIEDVLAKVKTEKHKYGDSLVAFFVDIVVIETGVDLDNLGLDIAEALKKQYPDIPAFNVTGKMSFDRHMDTFSEATLRNKDGVLSKNYLAGSGFNETRIAKLLSPSIVKDDTTSTLDDKCTTPVDIAILTALHDDEFENLKPLFEWTEQIENENRVYMVGKILTRDGHEVKIVAVHQTKTGMVDAAVIATEIINLFRPKFLIMPGVCGSGKDKVKIGDVIIAKEVFLFQKGKETDHGFKPDAERCVINSKVISIINKNKTAIKRAMEDSDPGRSYSSFTIHIEPMACSLSVIDKEGYFQENIDAVDRNAMAVDMESYAVARACELSGNNTTKAIIVKGVMDNTVDKNDDAKKLASYMSATVCRILISDVLPF